MTSAEVRNVRAHKVEPVHITSLRGDVRTERPDEVVGEEPLEIRLGGPGQTAASVGVTMRTPGNDFELAVGFLLSEGLINDQGQVQSVRYCDLPPGDQQLYNIVTVDSAMSGSAETRRRASTVTASCGICGTAALEDLYRRCQVLPDGPTIAADILTALPVRLRGHQRMFDRTGGLHGAGLFNASGEILAVREDIGRHNAVDKLVGWAALHHSLPLSSAIMVVSGRVSFEIVQKCAVAGIPILVAVSAPSSLAISTASGMGMTLAGFVRDDRANLYTCPERVVGRVAPAS
jgi:FdhD protein